MDAKVTKCGDIIRRDGTNYPCQSNYPCDIHHASQVIAGLRSQIAEMRKITGPPCPKCGHWLKAEHGRSFHPPTRKTNYYCKHKDGQEQCECEFPVAELGLTEANDGK